MSLTIEAHGFTLSLAPEYGGSVTRLSRGNVNILRDSSDGESDPVELSAFPMVPFSGRIASGRFAWAGSEHTLTANFPPEPHSIHGYAWQDRWNILEIFSSSATLQYKYREFDWPWWFDATQAFSLHPWGLELTMAIQNRGQSPMPAGLGWHPYFPSKDASIQSVTTEIMENGPDMIPRRWSPVTAENDLRRPRQIELLELDNAYRVQAAGTDRLPQQPEDHLHVLTWPDRTVTLQCSAALSTVVVYSPPGMGFFCVEPASHPPDAINSEPSALHRLLPGASQQVRIAMVVTVREPQTTA